MSESLPSIWESESPRRGPGWLEELLAWLAARRTPLLIAAGVFQVLVLLGMTVLHGMPLLTGETILLHVRPVDPRDPFRGDYVTLRYDINQVPPAGIEGIADAGSHSYHGPACEPEEQTVYVTLEPDADGRHYHGTQISIRRPESGKYIQGTYYRQRYGWDTLVYSGIQSYYVPEGTGKAYEDAARTGDLSAEIALTARGQAALRQLHVRPGRQL